MPARSPNSSSWRSSPIGAASPISTGVGQSVKALGLQDSDVLVTTARGVHAGPLAEFVFMALLAHWRGLAHLQAEQRQHRWLRYCGREVAGRVLAIVGAGDLARGIRSE